MHEILTIQQGQRANYLGAHFWNTQESYFTYDATQALSPIDHDVHFRPGLGYRGEETFTPRTLIYDLKGSFGSMRKGNGLYDETEDAISPGIHVGVWDRNIVSQQEAQIPVSEYQRGLDEGLLFPPRLSPSSVRYWSDFTRVFYHPRSLVQINDFTIGSSSMPFDRWTVGEELFEQIDRDVDILDRDLRLWAEECDSLRGIQLFGCCDDAWGGFGARYAERIRDEYGKTALWIWGIEGWQEVGPKAKQALSIINVAKSIYQSSAQATMYIPLRIPPFQLPPYMQLDRSSQWHLSGLLSMAVETMTLPSRERLYDDRVGLDVLESCLNVTGNQRIARLQCSIHHRSAMEPYDKLPDNTAKDGRLPASSINGWEMGQDLTTFSDADLDMDLSGAGGGDMRKPEHVFGRVESLRGYSPLEGIADRDESSSGMRKRRRLESRRIEKYYTPLAFPLLDSFPSIVPQISSPSQSVAVHSSLATSTKISLRIKGLQELVCKMVSVEERENLSNGLGNLREAYEEGWDSGSDDEIDD